MEEKIFSRITMSTPSPVCCQVKAEETSISWSAHTVFGALWGPVMFALAWVPYVHLLCLVPALPVPAMARRYGGVICIFAPITTNVNKLPLHLQHSPFWPPSRHIPYPRILNQREEGRNLLDVDLGGLGSHFCGGVGRGLTVGLAGGVRKGSSGFEDPVRTREVEARLGGKCGQRESSSWCSRAPGDNCPRALQPRGGHGNWGGDSIVHCHVSLRAVFGGGNPPVQSPIPIPNPPVAQWSLMRG